MDNGLIFPYHPFAFDRWGDGVWTVVPALVVRVQVLGWPVGKSAGGISGVMSSHYGEAIRGASEKSL